VRLLARGAVTAYLYSPLAQAGEMGGTARAFGTARASCRAALRPLLCRATETEAGIVISDRWVLYLPPGIGLQPGDGVGNAEKAVFTCTAVKAWPMCTQAELTQINDTEG
jgi:hypothetical protein